MLTKKRVALTSLKNGQSGIVVNVAGGQAVIKRLKALGVRVGKKIIKQSGMFLRGPITVQLGHTQLGIGHGMAEKIIVEGEL